MDLFLECVVFVVLSQLKLAQKELHFDLHLFVARFEWLNTYLFKQLIIGF